MLVTQAVHLSSRRLLNGKQRPATTQAVPLSSRRRLNGKQRLATALSADPSASLLAATAVAAECGDDSLALLPATVKRKPPLDTCEGLGSQPRAAQRFQ